MSNLYVVQTRINSSWIDLTFHKEYVDAVVDAQCALNDGNRLVRVIKRTDECVLSLEGEDNE